MKEIKNHGLVLGEIEKHHWVQGSNKATARFGAQVGEVNAEGDWTKYDPGRELQLKNGFETNACVLFATGSALIAQGKFMHWDFPKSSSERYLGVMCGTNTQGTDPHQAIEKIRTEAGLIPDSVLPWKDERDFDHYYAPRPMDEGFVKEGQKILKRYNIAHEWVFSKSDSPEQKASALKKALKRGTVCVSVRAWEKTGDLYTKDKGAPDTHWVWLVRYDGDNAIIKDQYTPFEKKLAPNYDFGVAKLYFITPNTTGLAPFERSYFSKILAKISETLKRLMLKYGLSK